MARSVCPLDLISVAAVALDVYHMGRHTSHGPAAESRITQPALRCFCLPGRLGHGMACLHGSGLPVI